LQEIVPELPSEENHNTTIKVNKLSEQLEDMHVSDPNRLETPTQIMGKVEVTKVSNQRNQTGSNDTNIKVESTLSQKVEEVVHNDTPVESSDSKSSDALSKFFKDKYKKSA